MTDGTPPSDAIDEILRLKREFMMPCATHFYLRPPLFVAAEDCELIDHNDRRYLDMFGGVTVVNAGHCNREINATVAAQLQRLDHTTGIYLSEPAARLAQRLADITPAGLNRSFFCTSGTEANEGALLLAALHTGRREFVSLHNGLHGRTKAAMSVTGLDMWRCDPDLLSNCHRIPDGDANTAIDRFQATIGSIGPHRIAAMIAEPIPGNGGITIPDREYWPAVRETCDKHRILLIFDEVQTGMNRTGQWWASQTFGATPDILTTAKALGNGYPIAALITNERIARSFHKPYASTFGGNPVGAAAALATIDFHEKYDLGRRSRERGEQLLAGLCRLTSRHDWLRRPRGIGLLIAADVADDRGAASPRRMDALLEATKDRGLLIGKTGVTRNVLTLMPPLTISKIQTERCIDILDQSCREAANVE